MDAVIQISAAAILGALLTLVIKKQAPEHAMLVSIACSVVLLLFLLDPLEDLVRYWDRLTAYIPYAEELASPLFKATGIAVIAHISAEFCRDCGQSALGAKVELAGTAACMLVMLPLADLVFELIGAML